MESRKMVLKTDFQGSNGEQTWDTQQEGMRGTNRVSQKHIYYCM